jgi:hypothetical protein
MKLMLQGFASVVIALGMFVACATPDWSGMSETSIASWKAMDVGPGDAQAFKKEGLDAAAVAEWRKEGFTKDEALKEWHAAGFTASDANAWKAAGFSSDDAKDWKKEKFSASEASSWKKAGLKLKEAISRRAEGLAPVK